MDNKLANVSFRIDKNLKVQADELFDNLGMNMTTAFNIFLRQSVREGRIPFEIRMNMPNAESIATMRETEKIVCDLFLRVHCLNGNDGKEKTGETSPAPQKPINHIRHIGKDLEQDKSEENKGFVLLNDDGFPMGEKKHKPQISLK